MAAFVNLSFEDQGATPGLAAGWTLTQLVSWPMAGFTGGAVDGPESYEAGWGADLWETELTSPVAAIFGDGVLLPAGVPRETYEAGDDGGWDLAYQLQLSALIGAEFNTTLDEFEGYESEWTTPPQEFKTQFVGIGTDLLAAVFDPGGSANAFESYEATDGWDAGYSTTVGSPTFALFGYAVPREDYELVRFRLTITVTPSTDVISAPAHPFGTNDIIGFVTTGRLPDGFSPDVSYYAQAPSADTLKAYWEPYPSTPIDIKDPGTGTHYVVADETLYWTEEL